MVVGGERGAQGLSLPQWEEWETTCIVLLCADFRCRREVKKKGFFDLLQDALSSIPSEECYVVLGDFNARVGSRTA